eukprot:262832_1
MSSLFIAFLLYSSSSTTIIHTSTNYIFVEIDEFSEQIPFSDANNACITSYNTSLATIKTAEQQTEVHNLITDGASIDTWIGIQLINSSPIWIEDGSSAQSQVSASWHLSENGFPDDNECVSIKESDGQWNSLYCDSKRDYICNRYPQTLNPTITPTVIPTVIPTINPSMTPTTNMPTTHSPTIQPTSTPTLLPSFVPSINPSITPNIIPTLSPTLNPTMLSQSPSMTPTITPMKVPRPTLQNGETLEKTTIVEGNEDDLSETKGDSINIALILLITFSILVLFMCILIIVFVHVYCKKKGTKNMKNMTSMTSGDNEQKGIEIRTVSLQTKNILPMKMDRINSDSSQATTTKNMSGLSGEDSNDEMYMNNTKNECIKATINGNTSNGMIDLENVRESSGDTMYENGEIEQTKGMTQGTKGMTQGMNDNLEFYAIALNEYIASDDDQLDFKENDAFCILEMLDSGWWFGCDNYGNCAWFPSNYLRKCDLNEQNELILKQKQKIKTDIGELMSGVEMDRDKYMNIELPPMIETMFSTNNITRGNV